MSRASDILQHVDYLNEEGAKLIVRVRNKKVQRKLVCPKFFKKNGMACLKLTASDAKKLSKMRKKQYKKKMRQKIKTILKKRAISQGIRQSVVDKTPIKIDDKGGSDE
jgi:hypothetical protein